MLETATGKYSDQQQSFEQPFVSKPPLTMIFWEKSRQFVLFKFASVPSKHFLQLDLSAKASWPSKHLEHVVLSVTEIPSAQRYGQLDHVQPMAIGGWTQHQVSDQMQKYWSQFRTKAAPTRLIEGSTQKWSFRGGFFIFKFSLVNPTNIFLSSYLRVIALGHFNPDN